MSLNQKLKKQKKDLDFEDLFGEFTEDNISDSSIPERMPVAINKTILKLTYFFIISFFLLIIGKIVYLQTRGSVFYQKIAEKSRSQINWIVPHRGIIFDRYGNQLVYNVPTYNLVWNKGNATSSSIKKENLKQLASIVDINSDQIEEKIKNNPDIAIIKENISPEAVYLIKSKKEKWKNFSIEQENRRDYLYPYSASHALGYVGRITENELKTTNGQYLSNDYIGKSGIELQYEDLLRGTLGIKSTEVSPHRSKIRPISEKKAVDGVNLKLTLDSKLQNIVFDALSLALKKNKLRAGSILAINPQNGDILAMVSLPSFNNSKLSQGMSDKDFSSLILSKDRPFFNRVISGGYPPGSTFKPLVAIAALEENVVNVSKKFYCEGFLRVMNKYNPQISYLFRDWKAHGWVSFKKAIAESCNVYFYIIGGGYQDFKGLGIKRIKEYANKFGLMRSTKIDLPGENLGLIPDKIWKKKIKGEDWYIGDTYHTAIGQGDVSLSPLQVSQIYSLFANRGTIYKPRLLKAIQETPGGKFNELLPEILLKPNFSQRNIEYVREGLRQTVVSGSAQLLKNLPIKTAAKTGTAQYGDGSHSHAWFVTFAPYDNPNIVLVVMLEDGGGGSATAGPVAYKILKWYFSKNNSHQ